MKVICSRTNNVENDYLSEVRDVNHEQLKVGILLSVV